MKTHTTALSLLALCALIPLAPSRAADEKQLQNMRGDVSFQRADAAKSKAIAVNAAVSLADKDYAITGADSLAGVSLPDSSRVLVGSQSKVQLAFFNQAQGNNAKFIVYNGRVRFIVQHPQGAKANYTFQTSTASIGVRGTEGDVLAQSDGSFTVNVYEVCDPSTPVVVTTKGGAAYTLNPGQSLVGEEVNGVVRAHIEALTQQLIDRFSPDFGVPTSWDAAKGEIVARATSTATQAADQATGGLASQVANLGGLFGHKKSDSTPSP
ncbi:MAG: FecR family protein, partial [Candidatus Baltobacteraceae bacterium]